MDIRILNQELELQGIVDNYSSLKLIRKYRGIDELQMVIDANIFDFSLLEANNIFYLENDQLYIAVVESLNIKKDVTELRVSIPGLAWLLKRRVTVPPNGEAYERHVSNSTETIVKSYINNNIVSSTDVKRNITYLEVATSKNLGSTITDQTRYKNLLSETIRLLTPEELGLKFIIDISSKKIDIDVYKGIDRTATNTEGNPPAIFSIDYDNIISGEYFFSKLDEITYSYVGGQGEGAARNIQLYDSGLTGVNRSEIFVDARDTNDNSELQERGKAAIKNSSQSIYATINPYSNLEYRKDFDLGDLVTVVFPARNITFNTRITELTEIYEEGEAKQIHISIGDTFKTVSNSIIENKLSIENLNAI